MDEAKTSEPELLSAVAETWSEKLDEGREANRSENGPLTGRSTDEWIG